MSIFLKRFSSLAIIIFLAFFILSCGESETKKKELELKEKELSLRERELALAEKKDSTHKQIKAAENSITVTSNYNYAGHTNFKTFWSDFKKAVNAGDKNAVVQMTSIPFKDNTYKNGETGHLSASSTQEFLANYNKIFTPSVIKAINANKYRGWMDMSKDEIGSGVDVIKKGEYLLEVFGKDILSLAFSKKGGKFKLAFIPYYS